jgi:Flp pilus assembly pilin Flp
VRFLRAEAGPTAVEYAVMLGLLVALGGAAAFGLGHSVKKSQGRVAFSGGSYTSSGSSGGARIGGHTASLPAVDSVVPWALLSLGVTASVTGGIVAACRMRDRVRNRHIRWKVRQALADVKGQTTLSRMVRQTARQPIVRVKRPDTSLIGRHTPDLHHVLRQRQTNTSSAGDLAIMSGVSPAPSAIIPAVVPALPVAG